MPPPTLSIGLSLANKSRPGGGRGGGLSQKRKKGVFDADSDDESNNNTNETGGIEISTFGDIQESSTTSRKPNPDSDERPAKRKPVPLGQGAKPKVKALSKASIFADDDEDEKGGGAAEQLDNGNNHQKKGKNGGTTYGLNLSALHSSKKHAAEAEELDPSIYSYDAVYDSLKAKPEKKKTGAGDDAESTGPRYMTSLLRTAEIRKRDQLRARDRLLAKEREAEGDEFADKEKFVTAAYKAQQEELRRVEEEEKKREEQEEERRRKNGTSGMVGFYRDLLSRGEEQHEAVMRAADEAAQKIKETGKTGTEEEDKDSTENTEAQIAAELNAHGARVAINDDGQVVDKRQLLSAGLNVAPKPKQAAPAAAGPSRAAAGAGVRSRFDSRQMDARVGQRARQTEMIAAQLEEQDRQQQEEEAARQKEIAGRSRSQKSAWEVSSARERYLARKKEREAAGKGS